jgi:hypothetical protein
MISTWVASGDTEGSGSPAGRIALIVVAVLAVAAYVMLQLRTRSRRKAGTRRYDPWDWRTYPEEGSPVDQALAGPEEGRRPEWRYGYPPGYEPYPLHGSGELPWTDLERTAAVRDQAS